MVCIPERLAASLAQLPLLKEVTPRREIQFAHIAAQRDRIHAALRAYTAIPFQYPFAQISRIGAQLPLVNAHLGAESSSAFGDFAPAPSAQRASGRRSLDC